MTAIVYDYVAIAAELKGDDWWAPRTEIMEDLPLCVFDSLEPKVVRTKLPEAKWRLLQQGKPIT